MNWMNLHHLKYFLAIAETGSLTEASKILKVGQPALSAQLKQFEQWLGGQLFDRVGKRLVLTDLGNYVLRYAREIKSLEDELIFNLGHASDLTQRELVVGVQESVPKTIIAHTIERIRSVRPVTLKVREGTGEELFQQLTQGKLDFFLGNFRPLSSNKSLHYISIDREPVSVWGSKKFASLRKDFPESLAEQSFILPGFDNPLRHEVEKYMLQQGINFHITIEAQDTALQKELASRSEGLIVLGENSVEAWTKTGRLVKLGTLEGMIEEYWLGMTKKAIDNDYVRSIIDTFQS